MSWDPGSFPNPAFLPKWSHMNSWSNKDLKVAKRILRRYHVSQFQDALGEMSEALGRGVTGGALRAVFLRKGLGAPSSFCLSDLPEEHEEEPTTTPTPKAPKSSPALESVQRLFDLTKRGPVSFADLCDRLDLSPAKTRALIDEAKVKGMRVHVEHDHVGIPAHKEDERVKEVGIAPVLGERQRVAVISDLHLGSKYCLRAQLQDFVHYAYSQGIREILCPGDVLDGMYRHGLFEVSHTGIEAQTQDLFETLPHLPGLQYRCITGNHDFTFTESCGIEVGPYIMQYFRERGREDIHFYGNRGAFLKIKGVVVHLWHPRSGNSYAKSYPLQKHIEKYSSIKPQVLLAGHWHTYVSLFERGVHAIACPTFQGGGSAFSKSLGGAPAIGGLILSWDLTTHGTIRSFNVEKRSYFEVEKPLDIYNHIDAIPVG